MRFVIVGAGAVGGVTGAMLARAGHEVVLVARGAHLDAIGSAGGVRVRSPELDETVPVAAVGSVAEVGWTDNDVAVLAVKSQDTAAVVDQLAQAAPPSLPVVSLQNGVANERMALRRFHDVYGVCVMLPSGHLTPGEVLASSAPVWGILDVGRWVGGLDERAVELAAAFESAGAVSQARDDISAWKHRKLIMNLANAPQAICGEIDDDGRVVVRAARVEGEAVLRGAGVALVSDAQDRERRGRILQPGEIPGVGDRGGGSTWQSLARGTGHVESDWLNGEIALQARLHRGAAPVNAGLQAIMRGLAAARAQPGSMAGADLRRALGI